MWSQVDPRNQQQSIVAVELGELRVAPVKLTHAGAVHQRDGAIGALGVPKLAQQGKELCVNINALLPSKCHKKLGKSVRCASFPSAF